MESIYGRYGAEKNPNLDGRAQNYIEILAQELLERSDFEESDKIIELIRRAIKSYDKDLKAGEDILYAQLVYDEVCKLKEIAVNREASDLETKQNILTNRIADEQKNAQDKFARLMPRATVNPEIWEDIKDGNLKRVWSGTGHKLGRAQALRSAYRPLALDEFTLKTKKERNGVGDSTDYIAEHIGSKQSEVEHGKLAKTELHEEILRVTKIFDDLKTVRPAVSAEISRLRGIWNGISNSANDVAFMIAEYRRMTRLMAIEEDQATGNLIDRGLGKVYQGYRSVIWADKDHVAYRETFEKQAVIESKIIEFETGLKATLRFMGGTGNVNVAENNNVKDTYSPESTNLREFESRQEHLLRRVKLVEGLLKDLNGETNDQLKSTDQNIYAAKMHKLGYEADIRDIDKIAAKWSKQNTPNLEKLFWHEFGDKVSAIREWQAGLPKIHRSGRDAYVKQTTLICNEYMALRTAVAELEKNKNFSGLTAVLERELGMARGNPFDDTSEVAKIRKELEEVKNDIRKAKLQANRLGEIRKKRNGTSTNGSTPNDNPSTPPSHPGSAPVAPDGGVEPGFGAGVEPGIAGGVEPGIAGGVEPGFGSGIEPKIVSGVEPGIGFGIEPGVIGGFEPGISGGVMAGSAPHVAGKAAPREQVIHDAEFIDEPKKKEGKAKPVDVAYTVVDGPGEVKKTSKKTTPLLPRGPIILGAGEARVEDQEIKTKKEVRVEDQQVETKRDVKKAVETREVLRPYEMVVIGDLHGNAEIFAASMKSLGLIEENSKIADIGKWKWAGGNKRLALLGDIVADRGTGGIAILEGIRNLEKQALEAGGRIEVLAGNHEAFLVGFLAGVKLPALYRNENLDDTDSIYDALNNCIGDRADNQGLGVMEFIAKFSKGIESAQKEIGGKFTSLKDAASYIGMNYLTAKVAGLGKEVLDNMRVSEEGLAILRQLSELKLVTLDGGIMKIHTEITKEIMEQLRSANSLKDAIKYINGIWKKGLQKMLLNIGEMPANHEFFRLWNIFLDSDNRDHTKANSDKIASMEADFSVLHSQGLTQLFHGHTDISYTGKVIKIGGVEIYNVDHGAGKVGELMDERSIAHVARNGHVKTGKEVSLKTIEGEVKDILDDIFLMNKTGIDEQSVELLKLIDPLSLGRIRDEFAKDLSGDMRVVMQYFASGQLTGVPLLSEGTRMKLKAAEVKSMIDFYFEWIKPELDKSNNITAILTEIAGYGLPMTEVPAKWRTLHGIKAEKKAVAEELIPVTVRARSTSTTANGASSNQSPAVEIMGEAESAPRTVPEGGVFKQKTELVKKLLGSIFPGIGNNHKLAESITKLVPKNKSVADMKNDFNDSNFKLAMRFFAGSEVSGMETLQPNIAMKATAGEIYELIRFYFNDLRSEIGVNGATIRSLLDEVRGLDMAMGLVPHQWAERMSAKASKSANAPSAGESN